MNGKESSSKTNGGQKVSLGNRSAIEKVVDKSKKKAEQVATFKASGPEYEVPKAQSARRPQSAVSTTATNARYVYALHAAIAQMVADRPGLFNQPTSSVSPSAITPVSLAYYLHWLCMSKLRDARVLIGAAVYDPLFASPPNDAKLPNGLAKFIQHYLPYRDKHFGIEMSSQFVLDSWPSVALGGPADIVASSATSVFRAWDGNREIHCLTRNAANDYYLQGVTTYSSALSFRDILDNQMDLNAVVASFDGVVDYAKIPLKAPDASYYVKGTGSSFRCAVEKFNPAMSLILVDYGSAGFGNTLPFQKPIPELTQMNGPQGYNDLQASKLRVAYHVMDTFMHLLSRCNWHPKTTNEMLQTCSYGPVSTIVPVIHTITAHMFSNLLAGVLRPFTVTDSDIILYDLCHWYALAARLSPWNWIGYWGNTTNVSYLESDPFWSTFNTHPVLATFISGLAPVILQNGTIVLPITSKDTASTQSWWSRRCQNYNRYIVSTNLMGVAWYTSATVGVAPTATTGYDAVALLKTANTPFVQSKFVYNNYTNGPLHTQMKKSETPIELPPLGTLSAFCIAVAADDIETETVGSNTVYRLRIMNAFTVYFPVDKLSLNKAMIYASIVPHESNLDAFPVYMQNVRAPSLTPPLSHLVEYTSADQFADQLAIAIGEQSSRRSNAAKNRLTVANNLMYTQYESIGGVADEGGDQSSNLWKTWSETAFNFAYDMGVSAMPYIQEAAEDKLKHVAKDLAQQVLTADSLPSLVRFLSVASGLKGHKLGAVLPRIEF